jgi:hypothetical protein
MPTRFTSPPLLLLVTASGGHLARQIQYFKAENEVLRARLPEHIRTTPAERAKPLKFVRPLGSAIQGSSPSFAPGPSPPELRPLGG